MKNLLATFILLVFFLPTGNAQNKKTLKQLRGEWRLDGMIQYGDTVFSMSTIDTNTFVMEFIAENKSMRGLKVLEEKDSLLMADIIMKRLKEMNATRIVFEKDSVYKSLAADARHNSYGRYWLKDANTLFIRDLNTGTVQEWELQLSKDWVRMEFLDQRMVFLLKKE